MHWGSFAIGFLACAGLVVLLIIYACDNISSKRFQEIEITIQQLKAEQTRLILLDDMAKTLSERQTKAEEIYKTNYPQWLKEVNGV